jgi:hypothetical protein
LVPETRSSIGYRDTLKCLHTKINKRTAINVEYFANLNRLENSPNTDALSIGIDLETGGHVFQLLFSNTQSIDDVSVLTDAEGDWTKRKIFFGFNILRVF